MRALVAVAIFIGGLACSLAGVTAARAADLLFDGSADYSTRATAAGHRAGLLVLYDFQPGVAVRGYWRAPWRHRHYYPTTDQQPELGRDEDLSAPSDPSEPAETFSRYWSTTAAFLPEAPRFAPRSRAPLK